MKGIPGQALAHHLAQELCLRKLDVWEGRIPEEMRARCKELAACLFVCEQSQDCAILPVIGSHSIPERALLAVSKSIV